MGDRRYERPLEKIQQAPDRASAIASLRDDEVVQALAAVSRSSRSDAYLANVLATEAMNRVHRHHAITSTAAEALVSLDAHGRVTHANPATSWLLGVSHADLVGSHYHEFLHVLREGNVEVIPMETCPIHRALASAERLDQQILWFERASGDAFPALASVAPIERDGSFDGVVLTFIDITERHRAQQALAQERSRLYGILDSLSSGVLLLNAEGRYEFANESAARLLGIPRERILASGDLGIRTFDLEGRPIATDAWPSGDVLRTGRPARGRRLVVERGDKTRIVADVDANPMLDAAGKLLGAVISFDDATEKVRSQSRLEEELQRHEAFFAVIPDAIFVIGRDTRIVRANPAAIGMTEDEETLRGREILALVHPADANELRELIDDVFACGQPRARVRMRSRGGRYLRASAIGFPLLVHGEVHEAYIIVRAPSAGFARRVKDLV